MCRQGEGAGALRGLDGHVVRWRGGLYMLHHTFGCDALLSPIYSSGGSMLVRPSLATSGCCGLMGPRGCIHTVHCMSSMHMRVMRVLCCQHCSMLDSVEQW